MRKASSYDHNCRGILSRESSDCLNPASMVCYDCSCGEGVSNGAGGEGGVPLPLYLAAGDAFEEAIPDAG